MKFENLLDQVFDVMKKDNPNFRGFTPETAKAMAAAWNVLAIVISSENTLDDLAIVAPNTNEIISIPLPADMGDDGAKNEEKRKGKKTGKTAKSQPADAASVPETDSPE